MTVEKDDAVAEVGLLEQIVTASSILERQAPTAKRFVEGSEESETDDGSEVFEDGDEDLELGEAAENEKKMMNGSKRDEIPASVAAVLTELSQVTSSTLPASNNNNNNANKNDSVVDNKPTGGAAIGGLLNDYATKGFSRAPSMAATINSINAILQNQLSQASQQPQKVRLSGPIRANVNIRHGVWAPRLRCRKRKNLHAKDGIWIHPTCSLDQLVALVKDVLPDEFEWDSQSSPLRYQAVNDQSLQSLKTVSGTVAAGQSLYSAFDLVRNRRSDGDNFVLQLYVYGTWTVLLKSNSTGNASLASDEDSNINNMTLLQPPPKKKYQQAHYSQQQLQLQLHHHHHQNQVDEQPMISQSSMFSHMRLTPQNNNNNNNNNSNNNNININNTNSGSISSNNNNGLNGNNYYYPPHPLAANAPVTFLPTVTLEMKLNGTFVPVEISKRSFMAAIRACTTPKNVSVKDEISGGGAAAAALSSIINSNINNNINNNNTNTNADNNQLPIMSNTTPPPSEEI